MSKTAIDEAYAAALANGALGGKLIGAGGGGFLMFYTKDHAALRAEMKRRSFSEVRYRFDFDGVRTINP